MSQYKRYFTTIAITTLMLSGLAGPWLGNVQAAGTPNGSTLNTHPVMVDDQSKIVSWVPDQNLAYDTVTASAWDYLLNRVPNGPSGLPRYYTNSYMNPDTQQPVGWPHNPAGLYAMLIESAVEYYAYSGDARVLTLAQNIANYHLDHGMTLPTDNWANVPYASGDSDSLTYHGASYGNTTGVGDGNGVLQPDKIGELGIGWLQLYQVTGNTRFRDAAIACADALAGHVRVGNATQSPWPFRAVAATGAIKEQYSAHVIAPIELLDELARLGLGNVAGYQAARTTAWNWLMAYPMTNNNWSNYFEDVAFSSSATNTTQMNAMMTARYLLRHPEYDAGWEAKVRSLIAWVEQTYGVAAFGANTIREQAAFPHAMGSHTSRYASINALLYEKTGDLVAKDKAYRAFNWATYMARSNGVVIDGPTVNNQWFTDGYGDYIRHFMVGLGAVPEWSPNGQNHLLDSTGLIKSVSYLSSQINYTAAEAGSTEKLRVTTAPTSVTADGAPLAQRTDLAGPGYTYNSTTGVVQVRHDAATLVQLFFTGTPGNQPPSISLTAPSAGASFAAPATINLSATAADSDGSIDKVEFFNGSNLIGTSMASPYGVTWGNVAAGAYSLTAKATDSSGAVAYSTPVAVTVSSLPSGWSQGDIGSTGVAGDGSYANNTFTVKGSGTDIAGTADAFHYVYQPLVGDGQITARVATQQNTNAQAKAGVMIRENLTVGSRRAIAYVTPTNGVSLGYRTAPGGSTTTVSGSSGAAPVWVRLARTGNTVTAFRSANGTSWTQYGTSTIAMGASVYMGLAVTSRNNSTLGTDTFTNVLAAAATDTTPPVISTIGATNVNQNGATVTWATNEPSDSQIDYGFTAAYDSSTALNTTLTAAHSLVVSGLNAATTYHYRVKSRDAAGNLAVSADQTFTTPTPPDTQAPSDPADLVATPASFTQVNLAWTASTDDTGVAKYLVRRDGVTIGQSADTSYSDATAVSGATYSYTVIAVDAAGNQSAESAATEAVLPTDTVAPSAPANLTAAVTSPTQITLAWTATIDNVDVTGYQIFRDGAQVGSTTTATNFIDSALTAGAAYTYTVRAFDSAGNVSADSVAAVATTPTPDTQAPTAPTGLNAVAPAANQVNLSWTAATDNIGVTRYNVFRNSLLIGTAAGITFADATATAGTTYTYTVTAQDAAANVSSGSNAATVTTPAAANPLTIDTQVVAHPTSAGTSVTSPAFTTAGTNELLVAFISSDGPSSASTFSSVTTTGLTWTLRKRQNSQAGTSEIWTAPAPTKLTAVTARASRSGSYISSLVVVAFKNASLSTIGAVGGASASTGAPTASLTTTRAGSWVWGVGNDWDRAAARTVGAGQTKVDEYLPSVGDTMWVQRQTALTPAAGTVVTINDIAPTNDRWNLAVVEILPAP